MKAVVAAFNQEKALVGAFSVITNLRMELFEALVITPHFLLPPPSARAWNSEALSESEYLLTPKKCLHNEAFLGIKQELRQRSGDNHQDSVSAQHRGKN